MITTTDVGEDYVKIDEVVFQELEGTVARIEINREGVTYTTRKLEPESGLEISDMVLSDIRFAHDIAESTIPKEEPSLRILIAYRDREHTNRIRYRIIDTTDSGQYVFDADDHVELLHAAKRRPKWIPKDEAQSL